MDITYEAMKEFKEISSRIDRQIANIEKGKEKTQQELNELTADYNQLIIDEATTGENINKKEMNKLTRKIKNRERDLEQFDDRINVLQDSKKGILEEHIPNLYEGYKEKLAGINNEIISLREEIIPKMSEYMKLLSKIGEARRGAQAVHQDFMGMTRNITDEFEQKYRFGVETERSELFISSWPDNVDARRGVTKKEQLDAVNGQGLPVPVVLYNLTGEQEPNHREAQRKYSKAIRAEREEVKNIIELCGEKSTQPGEAMTRSERDSITFAVDTLIRSSELFLNGWLGRDINKRRLIKEQEARLGQAYKTMDKYGISDDELEAQIKGYQKELRNKAENLKKQKDELQSTGPFLGDQA